MGALDLSEYVRVINRTGQTIKGRFDGTDFVFKHGEPTDLHQMAAAHIFCFGNDDKTNAFHRLGWMNPTEDGKPVTYEQALDRLNKIEFSEVPSPVTNIETARRKPGRPPKIGSPTPLAPAGADEGSGSEGPLPADA
jgi:hypothetical protein